MTSPVRNYTGDQINTFFHIETLAVAIYENHYRSYRPTVVMTSWANLALTERSRFRTLAISLVDELERNPPDFDVPANSAIGNHLGNDDD